MCNGSVREVLKIGKARATSLALVYSNIDPIQGSLDGPLSASDLRRVKNGSGTHSPNVKELPHGSTHFPYVLGI